MKRLTFASGPIELPRAGRSALILLLHEDCAHCQAFRTQLDDVESEITWWSCDMAVATERNASLLKTELDVQAPGIVIVDQWGDVAFIRNAVAHDFPQVSEILTEVQYLGTRCPECEGEAL